ncbi:MAG: S1 RNA-binding domain-containing protein [bacterium]
MAAKNNKLVEEILLARQENRPQQGQILQATVLAVNSDGIFLDINKNYEACITKNELGTKELKDYKIGDRIEVCIIEEERKTPGVYRASIKKIEEKANWNKLNELKEQNLEVLINKVVKNGAEVTITLTKQRAFIPLRLIDYKHDSLKNLDQQKWIGKKIPAKILELDESKNKIILDNKTVSDEQRKAKINEVISKLFIGQEITGKVVRTTKFGAFIEYDGIDILIPSSELSWARFNEPSDLISAGDEISGKVFKIDSDNQQIAISRKQIVPEPWTIIDENKFKVGTKHKGKVVSHAEFGFFIEVEPGIEALLHKSNYSEKEFPVLGTKFEVEITNIEKPKKRMGVKLVPAAIKIESDVDVVTAKTAKELEHAK